MSCTQWPAYLEKLQHAQRERLIAEAAICDHIDEGGQGTGQLPHGKHHLDTRAHTHTRAHAHAHTRAHTHNEGEICKLRL